MTPAIFEADNLTWTGSQFEPGIQLELDAAGKVRISDWLGRERPTWANPERGV